MPPVPPVPGAEAAAPPPSALRRAARSGVAAWLGLLLPPLLLLGLLLANSLNHDGLRAAVQRLSPGCIFHRLTGISCPGCGGTRALIALIDGHSQPSTTTGCGCPPPSSCSKSTCCASGCACIPSKRASASPAPA